MSDTTTDKRGALALARAARNEARGLSFRGMPRPAPERDYSGFPLWHVLRTVPGREKRAAERLEDVNVFVYLPLFHARRAWRGGRRVAQQRAVMPGLLFVPQEVVAIDNWRHVFAWARVDFLCRQGAPLLLTKGDVERVRRMEAKLNRPDNPVDAHGAEIKIGARVRFIDAADERLFGDGVVFAVASEHRIGVWVSGLFGGVVKAFVPAAEIEVM